MDAIEFIKALKVESKTENRKMSSKEFFVTDAGRAIINIVSQYAKPYDNNSFEIPACKIPIIERNSLYLGRKFLKDMQDLGFTVKIEDYYQDDLPIKTYIFNIK